MGAAALLVLLASSPILPTTAALHAFLLVKPVLPTLVVSAVQADIWITILAPFNATRLHMSAQHSNALSVYLHVPPAIPPQLAKAVYYLSYTSTKHA